MKNEIAKKYSIEKKEIKNNKIITFSQYILPLLFILTNLPLSLGNIILYNSRSLLSNTEITITIKGEGKQTFLNTKQTKINNINYAFPYRPSEILVNGELVANTLSYVEGLVGEENNITIIFNETIDNCNVMFSGLSNILKIKFENFDSSQVTNMKGMFKDCTSLISLDLNDLNTNAVEDMSQLFYNCKSLESLEINNFITTNVKNMNEMFFGCTKLTSLNIESFDTSSVTSMDRLFKNCNALKEIVINYMNTSLIENMDEMFSGCKSLISFNLSKFDTSSVTSMKSMFYYCNSLVSIDLSNIDTSKVKIIDSMFHYCQKLKTLDLSKFNSSSVISMACIFKYCNVLTSLNLNNFDTSSVTNMSDSFYNCAKLSSLNLSSFDTSSVKTMYNMFKKCAALTSLELKNFDTSSVTNMESMFSDCNTIKYLDLSNFNTSSVKTMFNMIKNCKSLKSINIEKLDTSSVTNMDDMFFGCVKLESLDLSNFDTSSVETMKNMFNNCNQLIYLNISSFDTSSVTIMENMFTGCQKLESLNISNFNTSSVKTMSNMFKDCSKLTMLDLNNFQTSSLTDMNNMFNGCSSIISLYLKNFDTSSVTTMENLFSGCQSLISLDLRNFDTTLASKLNNIFLNCNENLIFCFENRSQINNLILYISDTYSYSNNCSKEFFDIIETNIDTSEIIISSLITIVSTTINEVEVSNTQDSQDYYTGFSEITNTNSVSESIPQTEVSTYLEDNSQTSEITNINSVSESIPQTETSSYLGEFNSRTTEITNAETEVSTYIRTSEITNINSVSETNPQTEVSTYLDEVNNPDTDYDSQNEVSSNLIEETSNINEKPNLDNEEILKEVILDKKPLITENGTTLHGYSVEENIDDLIKQFPNLTFVYLGDCGEKLKKAYGLSSNEKLLVLIEDKPNQDNSNSINIFNFDVYLENGTQLKDLSACNDVKVTVSSNIKDTESVKLEKASEFKDLGYDIYNKSDAFYTDNCAAASDNGNDITLSDRKKNFYPNVTICNDGCEYNSVDYENQRFLCDCSVDENNLENNEEQNVEEESYIDYFLSLINYKIIVCYKLFFQFSSFYYNAGFYISFSTLFIFLILMIVFWIKGIQKIRIIFYENIPNFSKLKEELKKIKENNDNASNAFENQYFRRNLWKKTTQKPMGSSSDNLINKANIRRLSIKRSRVSKKKSKTFQNKNKNPPIRKKQRKKSTIGIKITDKSSRKLEINEQKSKTIMHKVPKKIRYKRKKRTRKLIFQSNDTQFQTELNIDFNFDHLIAKNDKEIGRKELNEIPFKQALRLDNRTTFQIFISVLENKIGILNLFFYKKKYSHFSLDLSIYLFELLVDLTMNCFLYTDDVVSEKYNNNGEISMFTSFSLSIISNIISSLFVFFIAKLVNYVEILEIILKNVKSQRLYFYNIIRYLSYIKLRLGSYFFCELLLTLIMTYYLFIFCSVYHQSQMNITVNYIIGACISLATSVGITIFITIFRNISFKR